LTTEPSKEEIIADFCRRFGDRCSKGHDLSNPKSVEIHGGLKYKLKRSCKQCRRTREGYCGLSKKELRAVRMKNIERNVQSMRDKTECSRGHDIRPESGNVWVHRNKKSGGIERNCRICHRLRWRERNGYLGGRRPNRAPSKCVEGHPLGKNNSNTYIDRSGRMWCRVCTGIKKKSREMAYHKTFTHGPRHSNRVGRAGSPSNYARMVLEYLTARNSRDRSVDMHYTISR